MRALILGVGILLTACASKTRCSDAFAIYEDGPACIPRIRHAAVGSDLKIPDSLKVDWVAHELVWTESALKDGQIVLGHFVLVPRGGK